MTMNAEIFSSICRHIAAQANEAWGEITSDPERVAAGRRAQIVARNQKRMGLANEEAARQLKDFLRRNRDWHFSKDHIKE
jgi:uncharacterized protein YjbJ (UPF0337 family)